LVVWGEGDFVFGVPGAEGYREDLKQSEVHILKAGYFALETSGREIARYMHDFLARHESHP
jgi:pimeloyl-ACP methyl ester carboxylesterase